MTDVIEAIQQDDIDFVNAYIERYGHTPVEQGYDLWFPLHWAVNMGRLEMVHALLMMDISPNVVGVTRMMGGDEIHEIYVTPLILAIQREDQDMVQLLLEWGADPNKPETYIVLDEERYIIFSTTTSPLVLAQQQDDREIHNLLLQYGAIPE